MSIEYDGELYDYVYPHINNELIFDIGSNIGEVVKRFVDKGAKVVAVEPQKELTTHKNYKGVHTVLSDICVSDQVGLITFYKGDKKHSTISTCVDDWRCIHPTTNWTKETMTTTTLDAMISFYGVPKYIKIDVEGFEHKVLAGLTTQIDLISFEFTQGFTDSFTKCLEEVKALGFKKMTTFVKKKIKGTVDGRRKTIRAYKLVDEFDNIKDVLRFFNTELSKLEQGDILIEA